MPNIKPVNLDNRTVRRILAAALAVWSRAGYHGSSLQDVADEAGVAKSLLHYHFASKEHLLIELQSVHFRGLAEAVRERLASRPPSPESALDALEQVWRSIVATQKQFPFAFEVWRASTGNRAVRARLHAYDDEMTALLGDGLARALGPLADRLPLPPDRLVELLQVAFAGFSLRLFESERPARVRRAFLDFKQLVRALLVFPAGKTERHAKKGGA